MKLVTITRQWILFSTNICLAGCSFVAQYPLTSLSTGIWGATGKTPTDHALSNLTISDCVSTSVVGESEVCQPIKPKDSIPVEDRSLAHSKK
jgi:hypothetical protein